MVGQRREKKKEHSLNWWQESALLFVIALVTAVVIKHFFLQAFYIPSESMEPGLINNDRILVEKVSGWTGNDIDRGDVVVFKDPGGWLPAGSAEVTGFNKVLSKVGLYPAGGHLVKRVVGTEGDTIKCCDEQGRLSVNGQTVSEQAYIAPPGLCAGPKGPPNGCNSGWEAGPIPDGHIFVMGDNRQHSSDSSYHMCDPDNTSCVPGEEYVSEDLVVGQVFALIWPQDRWARIRGANSFQDVPDPK